MKLDNNKIKLIEDYFQNQTQQWISEHRKIILLSVLPKKPLICITKMWKISIQLSKITELSQLNDFVLDLQTFIQTNTEDLSFNHLLNDTIQEISKTFSLTFKPLSTGKTVDTDTDTDIETDEYETDTILTEPFLTSLKSRYLK